MSQEPLYAPPIVASKVVRFGVEALDGHRSGYWRLWRTNKSDDVYLTARGANSALKVSLHESGKFRWGFVENYTATAVAKGFLCPDADRAQLKWARPASVEGWTHGLTVYFPARDVTAPKTGPDKPLTVSLIAPPPDQLIAVHVWIIDATAGMQPPGIPKEHAVVAAFSLPSGAQAVVLTAEQTVMTFDQTRSIDAAVLAAARRPMPWELIDAAPAGQLRLSLSMSENTTGAVRFVDLDAKQRLTAARRLVSG